MQKFRAKKNMEADKLENIGSPETRFSFNDFEIGSFLGRVKDQARSFFSRPSRSTRSVNESLNRWWRLTLGVQAKDQTMIHINT
jgi:hypothetical protein